MLAGAAILAGAFTSAAHGQLSGSGNGIGMPSVDSKRADEAAWAIPHNLKGGVSDAAFPQPLRPSDVTIMRRIFALQATGDIPAASLGASALEDPLLLGAVLADRYLGRFHRSTASELADWLRQYSDLPEAPAIYALLLTRLPKGSPPPVRPITPFCPAPPIPSRHQRISILHTMTAFEIRRWIEPLPIARRAAMRRPRCG
jgi:hypothetical protein